MTENEQLQHRHQGLALAVICVAQLMIVLDATIVNVALPTIARHLHFTPTGLEWVVTAYSLTFGGLLLLGGRSGDLFGRRRMFMIGIGLFSLASLAGGLAADKNLLIIARSLQGIGGAIAAPTALSLIATTFAEGPERNRAFGLYSAMAASGAAVGLLLGGILTNYVSWRWTLLVNVPIGLALVLITPRVLTESQGSRQRLDIPGAIFGTGGMISLVYGLSYAATHHWSSERTVVALVASVVLLVLFVIVEAVTKEPMLPFHLFRNRNRVGAYVIMLCIASAMFGTFFFTTLFLQDVKGWSPIRTGLGFLPMTVLIMAASIVIARFVVGKVGVRIPLLIGPALTCAAMLLLSRIDENTGYWYLLGSLCTMAVGMGCNFMPLTVTTVAGVANNETGIASALLNTGQQLGGAVGLATLGTIAAHAARAKADDLMRVAARGHQALTAAPSHAAMAHVRTTAEIAGYTRAFQTAAGIVAFAFLVSLVLIRTPKPRAQDAPVESLTE